MKKILNLFVLIALIFTTALIIEAKTTNKSKKANNRPTQSNRKTTSSNNLNGHEAVDLGLSVKWSKCNLGASSPFERGEFFYWPSQVDIARSRWGGGWRTPTNNEVQELYRYCKWEWKRCTYSDDTYRYCRYGYLITGPSGKSIFLPANGRQYKSETSIALYENGFYWTSCYSMERGNAKPIVLSFDGARIYFPAYDNIYRMGIRPVIK